VVKTKDSYFFFHRQDARWKKATEHSKSTLLDAHIAFDNSNVMVWRAPLDNRLF